MSRCYHIVIKKEKRKKKEISIEEEQKYKKIKRKLKGKTSRLDSKEDQRKR